MKSQEASKNSDLKVTVYWGDILYDTAICKNGDRVTVGRDEKNTFILDVKGAGKGITIAEIGHDGADLRFNDHIDGHLRIGKEIFSLKTAKDTPRVTREPQGLYKTRISKNDKADFVIDHVSLYFDWISKKTTLPKAALMNKQQAFYALLALLGISAVVFVLSAVNDPEPEKPPERLVSLAPRLVPGTGSGQEATKAAIGQIKTPDGGAQKGESGKAELKASKGKAMVASIREANLGSVVSGLASLGGASPSQNESTEVVAKIDQKGTGGFSTVGTGKGGGGHTVGIGRAVGRGEGGFEGTGRLGLSGDSAIESGTGHGGGYGLVTKGGGLDRDVIESVIRRRLDRIRLCYERQLNFNPRLAGKIAVHFIIGKRGEVLTGAITEDTMKNASVGQCILAEVRSWNFPAPEGGTLVNVDYPFLFESSSKGK